MSSNDKINRSLEFARGKHQSQHRRSGEPYINHLIETGELTDTICDQLETLGYRKFEAVRRENLRIAGYLHDIIEDTNSSYDDVVEIAGTEIANLVSTLSDDKRLPRAIRRQQYLVSISTASLDVKIVKLADVLSNLRGLRGTEPKNWIENFLTKSEASLLVLEKELSNTVCFKEARENIVKWRQKLTNDFRHK